EDGVPDLVPIDDAPQLPAIDRRRNLGLAYLMASLKDADRPQGRTYRARAREHLEAVRAAGLRDGATLEALAKIYRQEGSGARATALAQEALARDDLPPEARVDLLILLATEHVMAGRTDEAIALLEELTRLRRASEDWRILGACHLRREEPGKALPAFERALAIDPFDPQTHAGLAEVHRRLG